MEAEGEGGAVAGAVTFTGWSRLYVEPVKPGRSANGENRFQCESYFGGVDDKRDNPGPAPVARVPGTVSILLDGVDTSSGR